MLRCSIAALLVLGAAFLMDGADAATTEEGRTWLTRNARREGVIETATGLVPFSDTQ